jgi:activator of HSP90 ATPase
MGQTRRQVVPSLALGLAGLAAASQTRARAPDSSANRALTALHQDTDFPVSAERLYAVLLDPKAFAAFSGAPAQIDPRAGGAFSLFGGLIVGRNIELIPSRRIVQAWRPTLWDAGLYSIVRLELQPRGSGARIALDHSSFPPGEFDSLTTGWPEHYWNPLKKYLA